VACPEIKAAQAVMMGSPRSALLYAVTATAFEPRR